MFLSPVRISVGERTGMQKSSAYVVRKNLVMAAFPVLYGKGRPFVF